MAMGRKKKQRQEVLFVVTADLPRTPSHPFYEYLNQVLAAHGFDAVVEELCRKFYHDKMGRPSLPPGIYFRMLLIGYFEGIDSERGIAWRVADSLSLRAFVGVGVNETSPDHSTVSRNRRAIDLEAHQEVFAWVLTLLAKEHLLRGKTIGVDATTLEANAALRSIVRRDSKEPYQEFLTRLAQASGIQTPTREDLAKLDRERPKKGSNKEWEHPFDPEARITKMKDGSTHLAHKAEHAVDMGEGSVGAVLAVTLQGADQGDTKTIINTVAQAQENMAVLMAAPQTAQHIHAEPIREVIADKGYHSNDIMMWMDQEEIRSYASEPKRGKRRWKDKAAARAAVYANRRRIRSHRGKRLIRRRGELVERSMAHAYETGRMRRLHLRGNQNILKRLLVHVGGFNLSLIMRKHLGKGTPRGFQRLFWRLFCILVMLWNALPTRRRSLPTKWTARRSLPVPINPSESVREKVKFTTGC